MTISIRRTLLLLFALTYVLRSLKAFEIICLPNTGNSTCSVKKLQVLGKGQIISDVKKGDLIPQELYIYDQSLNYIPKNLGEKFPSLISLKIQRSKFMGLVRENFERLKSLKELNFWNNELKELASDVFNDLLELETLDLSDNDLKLIAEKLFSKLSNLKNLNLDSNELTEIDLNLFRNNIYLETLSMKDNNLKKLPSLVFRNSKNLLEIELDNNDLRSLPENIFEGIKDLKKLTASNNLISFIGASNVQKIKSLITNDFQYNICTKSLAHNYGIDELIKVIEDNCMSDKDIQIEWLDDKIVELKRLKRESENELHCAEQEIMSNSDNINSTRVFLADLIKSKNEAFAETPSYDNLIAKLKAEFSFELKNVSSLLHYEIKKVAEHVKPNLQSNFDTEAQIKMELNQTSTTTKNELVKALATKLESVKNDVKCDSEKISTP